jgi:tRNA(Ile)-lysidine synthase
VLAADTTLGLNGIFDGLTGFSRVAVAVSGGSDSMALLRLVVDWQSQPNGPRDVDALTVDHGLRPESASETKEVSAWCASLGVTHLTLRWQGEKPSTGIQAKARTARYDVISDWCREQRVPMVMTAHTADDQAETVLMRQQRTTTDRSLAAIWPENEWRGIKLLRPLLAVRRETLRDYLRALGQAWLEDPSNSNPVFERVRIRQNMAGENIVALQALAMSAQTRVTAADAELTAWLAIHMKVDDYAVIRLPRLMMQDIALERRIDVLSWVLKAAGDGKTPERANVEAIATWLADGRENRRSANGAIVSARRHVIEIMREPGRIRSRFVETPESGRVLFDDRLEVTAPPGSKVGPMGLPPLLKRPKDVPALAFSSLPVVKLADGTPYSAVKSGRRDISAMLCERFRV